MEKNLWNALHCTATKTEFAVLALYAQAISHPYMKEIHTPGDKNVNMLDLGPLVAVNYQDSTRIQASDSLAIQPTIQQIKITLELLTFLNR